MNYRWREFVEKIKNIQRKWVIEHFFPWWDYSYMLQMMMIWSKNASKKHLTDGHLMHNDRWSKELAIFSELCDRMSDSKADEEAWKFLDGSDYLNKMQPFFPLNRKDNDADRKLIRRASKKTKELEDFYHNYFIKLLDKRLRGWWD